MKVKLNQSKFKLAIVSAAIAGSASLSYVGSAYAVTSPTPLSVTTTISDSCTIAVTTNMSFTGYGTGSATVNGEGEVTSSCTLGGSVTITLGQGDNDVGGTAESPARRMKDTFKTGSGETREYLNYSLHTDSSRLVTWGNTAGTGLTYTATDGDDTKKIYGKMLLGQSVSAGAYADEIVVTLTF
jgi:spore coat protein U-like protein